MKYLVVALIVAALPLHATNVCPAGGMSCITISSGQNALTGTTFTIAANGENQDISPYSGMLSQTVGLTTTATAVTLFCDDVNNNAPVNTWWNVNVSKVTGNLSDTKFYTSNPAGASGNLAGTSIPIPTGTTLYEEEAWLYTQMLDLSGGQLTTANVTALQEAAWELTSNGESSAETTNASPWLTAAYNAVANNGSNGSTVNGVTLHAATYSDWFVFTDTTSPNNSGTVGNQEQMAYFASGGPLLTVATPEPSYFWLVGVLLIGLEHTVAIANPGPAILKASMIRALSCLASYSLIAAAIPALAQNPPPFEVEEATISQVHAAIKAGQLTCHALVNQYLRRIAAYDKNGPSINSIVLLNPDAEKEADELDRRYAQSGLTGPLHCVPMIVKDNFETKGLRTTNGALALASYIPAQDAFEVKRVKEAGAIVLAKSNMAEWAFSPYETVSSILPGYTRNPYALDRVTAGSSGGTAAAIAASFGLVGLGSDTGNSIRGPSSHQSLVGIRSTMGLTSRAGVLPLSLLADIAGPIARNVEDAEKVFQVIVGQDPNDPVTAAAPQHLPQNYAASLDRNGLHGAVIGVLRQAYERENADPEVVRIFMTAVEDLRRAGATIVDPATVEGLQDIQRPRGAGPCMGFKYDINHYLASRAGQVPVANLTAIIKSGGFHPSVQRRLEQAEQGAENGPETPACQAETAYRGKVRDAVVKTMDRLKLDAFVYPTWSNPPRLIGDLNSPAGDNSQFYSPTTGFPAINVPMGFSRGGTLPAGMTVYGRAWSEPELLKIAYAYEQATRHRRPPASTPPLR